MKKHLIGKHTVTNADLMFIDIHKELLDGKSVDIMYSDPPWGEGNLKYWQTIAKRHTGQTPNEVNYWAFLNKIFTIARDCVTEMVFIEYGQKWEADILDLAKQYGLFHVKTIQTLYNAGQVERPLDLHIFAKHQFLTLSQGCIDSVVNTKGQETLKQALTPFVKKGMSIIDPCCGMGYTAQFAINNQMTFYGNELNEKRLAKTIERLQGDKNK